MTEYEERAARRGRPSASSRETLEEAALELFLEQGYEQTSASDIARRAGVARSSFFNYFTAKADVLWVGLDPLLAEVPAKLEAAASEVVAHGAPEKGAGLIALRSVLLDIADTVQPESVRWAGSLRNVAGTGADLAATGTKRTLTQHAALMDFLARTEPDLNPLQRTVCSGSIISATIAATMFWIEAGPTRGSFARVVDEATAPILRAYSAEL